MMIVWLDLGHFILKLAILDGSILVFMTRNVRFFALLCILKEFIGFGIETHLVGEYDDHFKTHR